MGGPGREAKGDSEGRPKEGRRVVKLNPKMHCKTRINCEHNEGQSVCRMIRNVIGLEEQNVSNPQIYSKVAIMQEYYH